MRVVLVVLALAPAVASAQIYKCTGPDGKLTLTDKPCAVGEQAEAVKLPPPPETPYDRIMRENREARAASEARSAKREAEMRELRAKRLARYWERQERAGLAIGMTSDEVLSLEAWGFPDDKNVTDTAAGRSEQWIYQVDIDKPYKRMYLYFRNGRLAAVQG